MTTRDRTPTSSERLSALDDIGRNPLTQPTFGDLINRRFGRRDALRGALAVTALTASLGPVVLAGRPAKAAGFAFEEFEAGVDETHHVAAGYDARILIRWGDPVIAGAPEFDPANQTADAQEQQFGYNNDFLGYLPLPVGSDSSDHGLLVINHEYTNEDLMFPGIGVQDGDAAFAKMTKELAEVEMAAHGLSVIEIQKGADGNWGVVTSSPLNRRITARSTEMTIAGPAAGHDRLKTAADPTGTKVIGTINNCAGGLTPWGTVLTAEENFNLNFWGDPAGTAEEENHKSLGVPARAYNWGAYHDRFDVSKEPTEPNRFGWLVEIDPYDPAATPVKRTALGRFKHEGAGPVVAADGRVVVYSGDDERFEYLYKFISTGTFNATDRAANFGLLDEGTLYVAKFNEDGGIAWLPLVHGEGPLTAENRFDSQADVLIETRRAADLVGATPMDRPEDVEVNPVTGKVYMMLTNNDRRKAEQIDAANPRAENRFGHVVEITAADGDHAALTAAWEIVVLCGDPANPEAGAQWNPATTPNGWFGMPDNCAVDNQGRLWVATDGQGPRATGRADGLWALGTEGETRGLSTHFFRVPYGAEMCGPCFTPDGQTLFLAVQHPGEGGSDLPGFERASSYDDPATRWPDFQDNMPMRPSVVVVTKQGGGPIG